MQVIIKDTYEEMSTEAAEIIRDAIHLKPNLVLGLATGSTPVGTYRELIRMHKAGELDFSKVVTFNLDEYVGLPSTHDQSYYYFMHENLFDHVNIGTANVYVPSGVAKDFDRYCQWYEEEIAKAGGIDLQVLGIGSDGHIGFDEPGSSLASRTMIVTLTEETIIDNSRFFERVFLFNIDLSFQSDLDDLTISEGLQQEFENRKISLSENPRVSIEETETDRRWWVIDRKYLIMVMKGDNDLNLYELDVPRFAITMGVGTIMEAKHCLLLANGEKKADPVAALVEGPITSQVTASALQMHPHATVIVDSSAASKLKRADYYKWTYENRPAM